MNEQKPCFSLATLFLILFLLLINGCSDSSSSKQLKLGDRAPAFTATALDNSQVKLAEFKGSPVVLRFFLTDCPYCKADTPIFIDFLKKYQDRGLKMVYINTNAKDVSEVQEFVDNLGVPFPVVYDQAGTIATQYKIKTQPFALVLNQQQKIAGALLGGVSAEQLEEMVGPMLK